MKYFFMNFKKQFFMVFVGFVLAISMSGLASTQQTPVVSTEDTNVGVDGTGSVDVVLDSAPNGIQTYNITVSVEDSQIAGINNVGQGDIEGFQIRTQSEDSITFRAADLSGNVESGSQQVNLGTVQIQGKHSGTTSLEIEIHELEDDEGNSVDPGVDGGSLTVGGGSGGQNNSGSQSLPGFTLLISLVALMAIGILAWTQK